jgi:hypothetical protein
MLPMGYEDTTLEDKLMARVFQLTSYAANKSSLLGKIITEPRAKVPAYVAMSWFPGKLATNSIDNWLTFYGDMDSSRLPSGYKRAGIISFDKEPIDDEQYFYGGRHAVAFALGSAVMIGLAHNPEAEIFGSEPGNDKRYATAMRIGKGTLQATVGIWSDKKGFLAPPSNASSLAPSTGFKLESIPDGIPIV